MSAGGLSYSGLINYGATTLPSVESWGSNINILRDPSRSITTRKIDKVGETSSITAAIDESGNRVCEAIQVYGRGINPSVSVSYSNHGNNGGQSSGGMKIGGQTQAVLPYTIINDGAFRPPVRRQEELMPLSRMPRVWTSSFTQPGFVDFSKKLRTGGTAENTKEVKTTTLKANVRPTAVFRIDTPLEEPFEVKYVIQPIIKTSASSGLRTMDRTTQHVQKPTKEVNRNMVYAFAQSNNSNVQHVNNTNVDTSPFIQDINNHSVFTNPGQEHLQIASIEDIIDLSDVKVKDLRNTEYQTTLSSTDQSKYIHEDINLIRRLPEYKATTNINQNIYKNINPEYTKELERNTPLTHININPGNKYGINTDIISRDYKLNPKINAGSYDIPVGIPMTNRMQNVKEPFESNKSKMSRMVMKQHEGRYTH
jgi:hypothetical protein